MAVSRCCQADSRMGPDDPTWIDDVAALFAAPYWLGTAGAGIGRVWAGCMGPYGVDLTDYGSVRTNSVLIYEALHSRWMPLGAPPEQEWPDAALETFRAWVNQGWRRSAADLPDPAERIATPRERPLPMRIRRDLRSLTQGELDGYRMRFDDAFRVGDPAPDAPGQKFFSIHGDWCLHYQEAFLLWHRAYLMHFEHQLGCAVPYWNWFAEQAAVEGSPSAGLPQAFKDLTYQRPDTGETRPNPLRFAMAWNGRSKACLSGPQPGVDCRFVQRDPVLYTIGDDQRAARTRKIGLTRLYEQQVQRALALPTFSTPQGEGYPWANIPSFDPPPPDSDYVYRDVNFDGAYEQPHDNYHGWVGPDMADNAYTAFDPVFWSYHANIDRIFETWLRAHPSAVFTANAILRPFSGPLARSLAFDDPRRFAYTTLGDIAKDSRGLGYDYGHPIDPDFASPFGADTGAISSRQAQAHACCPSVPSPAGSEAQPASLQSAAIAVDELLIRFDDVRCTFDSFAIDAFLNLAEPAPDNVDAADDHYVGRFSRIGMGLADDKGRCVTQGVMRILDATSNARRLGLQFGAECSVSLLVTRLPGGELVTAEEAAKLPGFAATIGWYRLGRPLSAAQPSKPAPSAACCRSGRQGDGL